MGSTFWITIKRGEEKRNGENEMGDRIWIETFISLV
jgi:hypothetical protein